MLLCVCIFMLMGCESKNESLKKEYIAACADNDFAKAHSIVDEMNSVSTDRENLKYVEEANLYVYKKEALYLIAENENQASDRLMVLLKEGKDYLNSEETLNLALTMGNEYLANKLINSGMKISEANIKSACTANMMGVVIAMLDKNTRLFENNEVQNFIKKNVPEDYERYQDKLNQEKLEELQESNARYSKLPLPAGRHLSRYDTLESEYDEIEGRDSLNTKCTETLYYFINIKNLKCAQKVIQYYVQDMHSEDLGWEANLGSYHGDTFKISYNYSSREQGQKLLNQAIKNGEFK